jgi:hypothetical protein
MVATPAPERVPREGERCGFEFSSWTEKPEPLGLDKDSALGVGGGGESGSSRRFDDWRVGDVDDGG